VSDNEIIDRHDMTFDPGDPLNGSLYICRALAEPRAEKCDSIIEALRSDGLWSDEDPKDIPPVHREAYKTQLKFVAMQSYKVRDGELMIARFDHEKFPSSESRWESWKSKFDARYTRI
jgi:hypothetical protein